jgi:hypothetical protein
LTTCAGPKQVDFHEPTGAVITNMISDGPNMTDELQMTYIFESLHPNVEAGSDQENELMKQHRMRGKMSVDKSIPKDGHGWKSLIVLYNLGKLQV